MKYKCMVPLLSLLLLFLGGCGGHFHKKVFPIGVDPSFFPTELKGQTMQVFAFTNELLQEIGKLKSVEFIRVGASWDNLLDNLRMETYGSILSSMPVNLINQTKYSFSDPYLRTGPVLIVPKPKMGLSLEKLSKKIVAIAKRNIELELMSSYPDIDIVFYDQIVDCLEMVSKGNYDGALVPVLLAGPYVKDIFHDTLAISSDTLTEEGLRLVTLKGKDDQLISLFNDGLDELYKNGTYTKLLKKWSLTQI